MPVFCNSLLVPWPPYSVPFSNSFLISKNMDAKDEEAITKSKTGQLVIVDEQKTPRRDDGSVRRHSRRKNGVGETLCQLRQHGKPGHIGIFTTCM